MTKNFAHRGFSGNYPENTMLAFRKAVEAGADGIELDVQLTSDGIPVIFHDEQVDRTTNGSGYVRDHSLEALRALDASFRFTGQYGINPVPTLREYFTYIQDTPIVTNIELKTGVFEYHGIEEKVWAMIQEFGLEEKVIISSFNHFSILRMRALAPDLKYGLLSETWLINAGKYCHEVGVSCYHPFFRNLTPEVVHELKQYGIQINTYTVNTEEDVRDLASRGIDILIGNYPDLTGWVINSIYARCRNPLSARPAPFRAARFSYSHSSGSNVPPLCPYILSGRFRIRLSMPDAETQPLIPLRFFVLRHQFPLKSAQTRKRL